MAVEDIYREHWTPGIGDPTIMGWVTVAAYLVTAVLALRRMREDRDDELCCWRLWLVIAAMMFLLAINKQLDLQTWLTLSLKEHAMLNGWYQDRRSYQAGFIAGLGGISVLGLATVLWFVRSRWKDFIVAAVGLAFLALFVFARASSFHNMDTLIGADIIGFRINWILELGGIALVAFGTRYRDEVVEFVDD